MNSGEIAFLEPMGKTEEVFFRGRYCHCWTLRAITNSRKIPCLRWPWQNLNPVLRPKFQQLIRSDFYLHHRDNQVLISTTGSMDWQIIIIRKIHWPRNSIKTQALAWKASGNLARRVNSMEALEEASRQNYKDPLLVLSYNDNQKSYPTDSVPSVQFQPATDRKNWCKSLSIFDLSLNMIYEERNFGLTLRETYFFKNWAVHQR